MNGYVFIVCIYFLSIRRLSSQIRRALYGMSAIVSHMKNEEYVLVSARAIFSSHSYIVVCACDRNVVISMCLNLYGTERVKIA